MINTKFIKAAVFGICITALSTNMVLANTGVERAEDTIAKQLIMEPMVDGGAEPAIQPTVIPEDIFEMQRRIDQYLFIDHKEQIEAQGFVVTYTSPMQDFVEIGINPYSEEHANYLYSVLGKDKVKVVESEKIIMLGREPYNTGMAPDTPMTSPDTPVASSDTPVTAFDTPLRVTDGDIAEDSSAQVLEASSNAESSGKSSSATPLILGACAVAIIGGVAIIARKSRKA